LIYQYTIKAEGWSSYDSRFDSLLKYQYFYSDSNGELVPIGEEIEAQT
jgi:hypothetical protein